MTKFETRNISALMLSGIALRILIELLKEAKNTSVDIAFLSENKPFIFWSNCNDKFCSTWIWW